MNLINRHKNLEIKLRVILGFLYPGLVPYSTQFIWATEQSEVGNIFVQNSLFPVYTGWSQELVHYFFTKKSIHSRKAVFWRTPSLSQNLSQWNLEMVSLGFVELTSPDQRALQWKPPASTIRVELHSSRYASSDLASMSLVHSWFLLSSHLSLRETHFYSRHFKFLSWWLFHYGPQWH